MTTLNPAHMSRTSTVAPRVARPRTSSAPRAGRRVRTPWVVALVVVALAAVAAVATAVVWASTFTLNLPLA
jgi:hypothetical protein